MLASALLRAGALLGDRWAREHALATLGRIRGLAVDGVLPHSADGTLGFLEDQVQAAAAAIDAFEATGDGGWLDWAGQVLARAWADHHDGAAGGLFDTPAARAGEGLLPAPAKPIQDSPTPSANGVAAVAAFRLAEHLGSAEWRARGEALVRAFGGSAPALGFHAASWLLAADWMLHPAAHLVVTGAENDPDAERMHVRALATFVPRRVVRRLRPSDAAGGLPPALATMLAAGGGRTAGYFCVGAECRLPAPDDAAWAAVLGAPR
jgi:uncharacterized protein YyaL (SSP411 family)